MRVWFLASSHSPSLRSTGTWTCQREISLRIRSSVLLLASEERLSGCMRCTMAFRAATNLFSHSRTPKIMCAGLVHEQRDKRACTHFADVQLHSRCLCVWHVQISHRQTSNKTRI